MVDVNEKKLDFAKKEDNTLLPFQLEKPVVRGRIVRLNQVLDSILERHNYPEKVGCLLSEATAMAAALGSALKFDGIFTIQTQTDGPVYRLVVDVTSNGAVRACASFDADRIADSDGDDLLGSGHLIFTVDQKNKAERYQGVVKLDGESLTEAFQLYFKQSEQIPTGIMCVAHKTKESHWQAACLMVQRMPRYGGEESDVPTDDTAIENDWLRVMNLMQTCTFEELLDQDLPVEDLLYRLFHEEGVRVYDKKTFRDECRCSREKVAGLIQSMSDADIQNSLDENGKVSVTCQFCGESYDFTPEEIKSKAD